MTKKIACIFLTLLILVNITPVCAKTVLSKEQTENYLYDIAYYEQSHIVNPSYGSIGGEWMIMGLARYGAVTDKILSAYKTNLKAQLKSCDGELSSRKYTEYARVVIALTAIEENPENFGGYNLLKPLAEYDTLVSQGLNGVIYGLIALDCGGYDVPKPSEDYSGTVTTRDKLVQTILSSQKSDGGWNFSGTKSDTDMTAMAIQALAPYYKEDKVKKAVDRGLDRLGELQLKDGSFASGSTKNCESTAQVLTALSVINVSVKDDRFVKDNKTVLDGLMQYYKSGGFSHLSGGSINQMATEQAMYALTAYYRSISGMNGLFEMKDGMSRKYIEIKETDKNQKIDTNNTERKGTETKKTIKRTGKGTTKDSVEKIKESEQEATSLESAVTNEKKKKREKKTEIETVIESEENGETVIVTRYFEKEVAEIEETSKISKKESDRNNLATGLIVVVITISLGVGVCYIIKRKKD
jgi:hypothetical protein